MNYNHKVSVFLFAHQDDEFGVFHELTRIIESGHVVYCVYLTDGGADFKKRNEESTRALNKIGVAGNKILFQGLRLGVKDGCLVKNIINASEWLLSFIKSVGQIEHIYTPAWEGGHPDHDVLHAITVKVASQLKIHDRVYQFSLYNAYMCRKPFFRVMSPLPMNGFVVTNKIMLTARFRIIGLCLSYPSQLLSWVGLFPFVAFSYLFTGEQYLQLTSMARLYERPHEGRLYYEARGFASWEDISSAIWKQLGDTRH